MKSLRSLVGLRETLLLAACVLVGGAFALASPNFATSGNLATILRNSNELLLVGLGTTLLLAMGGIDVAVGVQMGLAAIGVGHALLAGWPNRRDGQPRPRSRNFRISINYLTSPEDCHSATNRPSAKDSEDPPFFEPDGISGNGADKTVSTRLS